MPAQDDGYFDLSVPELVSIAVDASTGCVIVAGELDDDTAPVLLEAAYLVVGQRVDLTVDLTQVTLLGAAGMNALVELHHAQRHIGRELRLTGVSEQLRRVLRIGAADWLLMESVGRHRPELTAFPAASHGHV